MATNERPAWLPPKLDLGNVTKLAVQGDIAWKAIVDFEEHTHPLRHVFLMGDTLVRVSRSPKGDTKLQKYNDTSLADYLDRIMDCGVWKPKDDAPPEWKVKTTPKQIASNLLARNWDLLPDASPISRVTDVPVFGKLGSEPPIIFDVGYHPNAETYYEPARGLPALAAIGEHWDHAGDYDPVQKDEVWEARDFLLGVFEGFQFEDSASWTHALCMMLEPFARELIGDHPTPCYCVTAQVPGTGKSLLVQAALYPACAERLGTGLYNEDAQEMRKNLTGRLLEGAPAMCMDNVPQGKLIDSHVLAAALSAPGARWDDRVLGSNRMANVSIRNVWTMSANKPMLSEELTRRMVPIRLTTPRGEDYQYKYDLEEGWLEDNRERLVQACLTLVLNYVKGTREEHDHEGNVVAYRPTERRTRRSYRQWSRIMGGILKAAGVEEFLGNLDDFENEVAVHVQDEAAFLRQWYNAQVEPQYLKDLALFFTSHNVELPIALQGLSQEKLHAALGTWLKQNVKHPPRDGYKLAKHGADSPYTWSVEKVA